MRLLISTFAAITTFAAPAFASQVILPNLYADKYCTLRRVGVQKDEAMTAAIKEASIPGEQNRVMVNGKSIGVDVIAAVEAVTRLCPEMLKQ